MARKIIVEQTSAGSVDKIMKRKTFHYIITEGGMLRKGHDLADADTINVAVEGKDQNDNQKAALAALSKELKSVTEPVKAPVEIPKKDSTDAETPKPTDEGTAG